MPLKYKRYDQLMASVESDLRNYAEEGLIDRSSYIKTVRKVNSDLGLKIYQEKDAIIEVKDYKALLPSDFMFLQLALACLVSYSKLPRLGGIQTEQHVSSEEDIPIDIIGDKNKCCVTECDGSMWVTQKIGTKTHVFQTLEKLTISKGSQPYCADMCLNFRFSGPNQMHIDTDGETVHFSFREGKVYINYLSDMIDELDNVLVLDHPLVNDYYEYAVKNKFFENMELNKEGDFLRDYQLTSQRLRSSRIEAIGIVNTPEYGDIIKMHDANRRRFYNRYVKYFDEYNQGVFKI